MSETMEKTFKLDPITILIMQGIEQHKSMDDIRLEIRQYLQKLHPDIPEEKLEFKSIGSVYRRVRELESVGLITPPPRRKQAKARELTDRGSKVLKGYAVK